jgi:hypothetical protein
VFINVQTLFLDAARYAQTVNLVKTLKDKEAHAGCPSTHHYGTKQLGQEERGTEAVEPAFARGEETREQGARETAHTVYRRGTYGVIDMQYLINKVDRKDHQDAADGSNQDGARGNMLNMIPLNKNQNPSVLR